MNETPLLSLEDTTDICQLIRHSLKTSAKWNQLSDVSAVLEVSETGAIWQMLAGSQLRRDGKLIRIAQSNNGSNPSLNPGRIQDEDVVILRTAPQVSTPLEEQVYSDWGKITAGNISQNGDSGLIPQDSIDKQPTAHGILLSDESDIVSDTEVNLAATYSHGTYRNIFESVVVKKTKPTAMEVDDLADIICETFNADRFRPYYCRLILRHGVAKVRALFNESLTKNRPANYFSSVAGSYDKKFDRDNHRSGHA